MASLVLALLFFVEGTTSVLYIFYILQAYSSLIINQEYEWLFRGWFFVLPQIIFMFISYIMSYLMIVRYVKGINIRLRIFVVLTIAGIVTWWLLLFGPATFVALVLE
jgi:hypothetical protein